MGASISATPEARAALQSLRASHGDIVLHLTGGWVDSRTPLVLAASELRLGARDALFGEIDGVKIYQMSGPEECKAWGGGAFALDLVKGLSVGFSLEVAPGKRFILLDA